MKTKEIEVLEDMKNFISFGINFKKDYLWILGNLAHDIGGIMKEEKCFSPRSKGYKKFMEVKIERVNEIKGQRV